MKYLVQVESKRLPVDNVENVFKYLDKIAEDMREKGVQEVDESLNDMKELVSDFLFELVSICEDEEYFEKELNEIKQSEELKKELDDLLGDEFDLEDFKEVIRQVNNENQNSIRKFYEKDYKTFRKLIDGYESVLLENGSILEIIRYVSKTSTLGSLLNYFLEHGTLTDIFTDD